MKRLVLSAVLSVCATSAFAETRKDGCYLVQIPNSNAYYRSDVNCQFGSSAKVLRVKAAAPADPAPTDPVDKASIEVPGPIEPQVVPTAASDDIPAIETRQSSGDESEAKAPVEEEHADSVPAEEPVAEEPAAETPAAEEPATPVTEEEQPADQDNGHDNDADGVDYGNPGNDGDKAKDHEDNGHGNDADGVDESNPGQGGDMDKAKDHDDNGHGNDADGVDESNPGKGGATTSGKDKGRNKP